MRRFKDHNCKKDNRNSMWIILLLLWMLLFKSCNKEMKLDDNHVIVTETLEIADGSDWKGNLPERYLEKTDAEQGYIEVAGYANLLVTEEHQTIELINMTDNTVYQQYIISFNGEQLFDSKLIPPGKQVEWNAYEMLEAGNYELVFEIRTYDIRSWKSCNGANQTVVLEVKKK